MENPDLDYLFHKHEEPKPEISEAKLRANRENALHSSGPVTRSGLEKSSRNALKTGLTGDTVLLPTDDPDEYRLHIELLKAELKPVGEIELQLVQRLADAHWRLNRIPTLERNMFKYGRVQFAALFENENAEDRPDLIQAHTLIVFQTQFKNLSIQETRIRRGYNQDLEELKSVQSQRGKLESNQDLLGKWPAPWPGGRKTGFEFAKNEQEQEIVCQKIMQFSRYDDDLPRSNPQQHLDG